MEQNNITDPKAEAMLEHLILQGAIEISSIDPSSGETFYTITDKLKEVSPELYRQLENQFNNNIFEMIKRGPVAMEWKIRI